jgi:hypothetical protein
VARCVFFSFHFEDSWKVNQVRHANVVHGRDTAGYIDHSEYLEAERKGEATLRRLIDAKIARTTVTVVLIGHRTAERPWMQYEIQKSIEQGNGLLGVYIHHLKDRPNRSPDALGALYNFLNADFSGRPPRPGTPPGIQFPTYDWDGDVQRFAQEIEAAGQRADAERTRRVAQELVRRINRRA